jgi:hypothetical protein
VLHNVAFKQTPGLPPVSVAESILVYKPASVVVEIPGSGLDMPAAMGGDYPASFAAAFDMCQVSPALDSITASSPQSASVTKIESC